MNNYAPTAETNQLATPTTSTSDPNDLTLNSTQGSKSNCVDAATKKPTDQESSEKPSRSSLETKIWELLKQAYNIQPIPSQVHELMIKLSAMKASLGEEIAIARSKARIIMLGHIAEGNSAAASEAKMESSIQYIDYDRKKKLYEGIDSTLSSLTQLSAQLRVEYEKV